MAIFGIGAGRMELQLERNEFRPGETIVGTAKLQINEQLKARGVKARLWAERTRRTGKHTYVDILFDREIVLDSAEQYSPGVPKAYNFQFEIPIGVLSEAQFGQGVVGGAMGFLKDMANSGIRWYVQAKLDLPMALDVSAKRQINVQPRPQGTAMPQDAIQN